jgi:hypothetical protein
MSCSFHPLVGKASGSATGKKRGHLHSLNRHGPLPVWMNSPCRHQEQALARLASRSIQRTAERFRSDMETHRRLRVLQRHRLMPKEV